MTDLADVKKASASIGRPIERIEDARLLKGQGRYIDDLRRDGMLHAAIVRSAVAHGRIRRLVNGYFSAKALVSLADRMETVISESLDEVAERGTFAPSTTARRPRVPTAWSSSRRASSGWNVGMTATGVSRSRYGP